MRFRFQTWFLLSALLFLAGGYVWRQADEYQAARFPVAPTQATAPTSPVPSAPAVGSAVVTNASVARPAAAFPFRLANTTNTVGQLTRNPRAILLENALFDTATALPAIPARLRAVGDPGSYIVQARGPVDAAFRAQLQAAGATIVSYIPNNAYLVRATAAAAKQLAASAQAVLPYEPYYKLSPALLGEVLQRPNLPPDSSLAVVVFPDARAATVAALHQLGAQVMAENRSPFGPMLTVVPTAGSVAALAGLPGVANIAKLSQRIPANDLSRARIGVAADSRTPNNYLNLKGNNVLVELNDSGVDATHHDLVGRVISSQTNYLVDTSGHGTHVAGIIAGDGTESKTVTKAAGSIMPGTNSQFRGSAPAAKLFVMPFSATDEELQAAAALTNALISNNSWNYGTGDYDIFAASYDAAVRDALPGVSGSQPVLFVFSAGNGGELNGRGGGGGFGGDNGLGGFAGTVLSPATAKNVITVGAIELPRHITNNVTVHGQTTQPWAGQTDNANQVAGFSARGNVGIGTEGEQGRFKPDVVAPGTFVVSTRSAQWETNIYYSNTNYGGNSFGNQVVNPGATNNYSVFVPNNAVQLTITVSPAANLLLFVNQSDIPTAGDVVAKPYSVTPPTLTLGNTLFYSVASTTNVPVTYNVTASLTLTNDVGDYYQVLQKLNDTLVSTNGGQNYYRYETGTSMSAADVSGTLALIQDFFTNKLQTLPSPALMKALVINGARSVNAIYDFQVQSSINYQGWGLINLSNSIPASLGSNAAPNTLTGGPSPVLWFDQSPANALATGDQRTFKVTVAAGLAKTQPLRFTLVWTDPPGNPAAGVKLVNNLDLVVTNLDNNAAYYGNDIGVGANFNFPAGGSNAVPNLDVVNNVENVYLAPPLSTNGYSVTVIGRAVNVNAVTAQTNNVSQDYALVVSSGNGTVASALTVTASPTTTSGNQSVVTVMTNEFGAVNPGITGQLLQQQHVGANYQLLGTNTVGLATGSGWGTNGQVTLGVTNQWRFYVVTNTSGFTNAVFATFLPPNLALSRGGVADVGNADQAARPEADVDLYVSTDPGLTTLNSAVIANCVIGTGASRASLSRGGTEYVVYSNSASGTTYYVGVKSEDQQAAEFAILGAFSQSPLSGSDGNGGQTAVGINLPAVIPDGGPAQPGSAQVLAVALLPMQIRRVVVTNTMEHENFGDLVGVLNHSSVSVTLNNHTFGNGNFDQQFVYEDNGENNVPGGSQHTDGPGSLTDYIGKAGQGVWLLTEVDNSLTHTGQVVGPFLIHMDPQTDGDGDNSATLVVQPQSFAYDYIDVLPNVTNLTICVANKSANPGPLQLYVRFENLPNQTTYDYTQTIPITGGCLSIDLTSLPPLRPGRYYVGIFNPNGTPQTARLTWTFGVNVTGATPANFASTNLTSLLDDAITNTSLFIANTQLIASVNVGIVVEHPRISDLTFTLVSPTGQRVLLMENRGGNTTNGAGSLLTYSNVINVTATGGAAANTNYLTVPPGPGVLPITYNFYTVPDEMTIYAGTNPATFYPLSPNLLWDSGFINNPQLGGNPQNTQPLVTNISYLLSTTTNITIIMNQFGNPYAAAGDAWWYTAGASLTNFQYLMFTEDSSLTKVPIKYAVPPFNFTQGSASYVLSDFDLVTNGNFLAPATIPDPNGGWFLPTNHLVGTNLVALTNNQVSVVTDPANAVSDTSSNYLALATGTLTRSIPTVPGQIYNVTFWYRGPGISSWWRGEGDATDSSDPEKNANNGSLIGRFNFPAGEVGQAFQLEDAGQSREFAGTNTYVQIRQPAFLVTTSTNGAGTNVVTVQSSALDVGTGAGFTVEGWINPTNIAVAQPLVEWLARVPTNAAVTNLVIEAGPFLNPATGHYYYLLGATNWTTSEFWATQLGGHLATVETANEENWIYDTFSQYGAFTNANLWIGLTNSAPGVYKWSSGLTNITYANWAPGQPTNCGGSDNFVAILGPTSAQPGLWTLLGNEGGTCGGTNRTRYGLAEVPEIQPNGVQFWISVSNSPGCLFADLVDSTNGSHQIVSTAGVIHSNTFQHVALTYDTNSGFARLYYNGSVVASNNLGLFIPKTTGDVLLGKDMSRQTNNFFSGKMDELSIYRRALSAAEIAAIYQISAQTTNRATGKFDPAVTPAFGLAEAQVVFGSSTNLLLAVNDRWQVNSFTFTATTNAMPLSISGLEPGILLSSFNVSALAPGNLYYLPEQSLQNLVGQSANGQWSLEMWDNRAGNAATNAQLVSWELQFVLQTNTAIPTQLGPQTPSTNSIPPNSIAYFTVDVPAWANFATNILVSSRDPVTSNAAPVSVLFNQNVPPVGAGPGDVNLLAGSAAGIGSPVLSGASTPPLLPGQRYYLGVTNPGPTAATVVLRVDFDITGLTNGIPLTGLLDTSAAGLVRYFAFDVTATNAYEATFQLLKLSGNADLVVRKGVPLPTLTSTDYGSFNATNADENIYVLTNSAPMPLTAGRWYLGVFRRDAAPVTYSVLAKELDLAPPTIIELTNRVPFTFTAAPGAALTNFFRFHVADSPASIRFQLYGLNGNGDLTVQTNLPPYAPPFFQSSQQPGLNPELVVIPTNSALPGLAADWYLGVPNHELTNISYTILAQIDTNGPFPAFPGAEGAGAGAVGGRGGDVYHVWNLNDAGPGSLREGVLTATNAPGTVTTNLLGVVSTNLTGARTIVFDVSGTITLASPLVITNSLLTLAGQTAPGCCGINIVGQMTTVSAAHDVILRYLRFRPGAVAPGDALQLTNVSQVVADHVSLSWDTNALLSVLNSSNVTVQWSVLADSLVDTNKLHGDGTQLRYGPGSLSFHHNLYADNNSASPRLGDNLSLDFVNNVIYDWGKFPGLSADDSTNNPGGFTNYLNYVCNYVIASPNAATNTAQSVFWGGTTNTWIYQTNNFLDADNNGLLNGADGGWAMFGNQFTPVGWPFPLPPLTIDEAFLAYEKVLDFAGAALAQRDSVDTNIVGKVRTQTGVIIATGGTLPVLNSAPPWLDWDQDGLPDFWETTFGQSPTNASNNQLSTNVNFSGYTDLEEYQAWLGSLHALTVTNTPVGVDLLRLCGQTGNLSFLLTNAVNGSVYLTNVLGAVTNTGPYSNSIAIFTPTTNYSGYASFGFVVTNNATVAHFPASVSVLVSAVPVLLAISNTPPLFTNTPPKQSLDELTTLTVTNAAVETNAGVQLFYMVRLTVNTNAMATNGWTNSFANITNTAPSIDASGVITWMPSEAQGPGIYTITTIAADNGFPPASATNSFSVTVNEVNTAPTNFLSQTNYVVHAFNTLVVSDTATDSDLPLNPLTYSLVSPLGVSNATLSTNGIFTWTPTTNSDYTFTVIVTDTNAYALSNRTLSATNSFTVTVQPPSTLNPGGPQTNSLPPGSLDFYQVNVPTNADFATNILLFATNLPVNVWFSPNQPPTITNPNDVILLPGAMNGSSVLSTVSSPTNIVPGGIYYLGVQNPNNLAVTYALAVNFHLVLVISNPPLTPPVFDTNNPPTVTMNELTLLTVPNHATDTNLVTLSYSVSIAVDTNAMATSFVTNNFASPPPVPIIDPSGTINWYPGEEQGPGIYVITTVVTDNSAPPLSVTNSFSVIVFEVNTPPYWTNGIPTSTNFVLGVGSTLTVTNTATDSDLPPNPLSYTVAVLPANTNAPAVTNAVISTNGVITWTPLTTGNFTLTTIVTDANLWTSNNQSLSATNYITVTVTNLTTPSTNVSSIIHTNLGGTNGFLLTWFGPSNALFQVQWATSLTPANWTAFTNLVAYNPAVFTNPTNTQFNFFDDGTQTSGFGPVRFYRWVLSTSTNALSATINLTNGVPFSGSNSGAGSATNYYHYVVTNNPPGRVQFEINNPSGNLTLVARKGLPLPSLGSYDYLSANPATNDELIVVLTNSTPALTTGDWYLAAINVSGGPVTYAITATEWPAAAVGTNGIVLSGSQVVSNEFCFSWNSLIGAHYYVQAKSVLSATNWTTISPTLTATGTNTTWCVGLPTTNHFFRVVDGLAVNVVTPPPVIQTVTVTTNTVTLGWNAPTSAQFNVQLATNLPPLVWFTFTNLITSTNGAFTFTDDGSQTGSWTSPRFYRLKQLP